MPVMDGLSLLRTLRQRAVPSAVLMLADDEFLHGLAVHAGADRFLAQPITPDDVLVAVAALARSVGRRDSA